MNSRWLYTGIFLTCIIALATFVRLHDIKNYPAGLFPDEAANGEDVQLILSGDTRPFYPRGNGREAMFFYIQAAFVKVFGIGVWQMHAASAVVGIATVIAMYFATRVYFGRLSGLLAALFLATSSWHIALSRTGFRAIQIPLVILLFTAFVGYAIKAVKEKRIVDSYIYAALAGISFASGFYTYIAYRAMIGVILGIVILMLLAALHPKIGFPHGKRYGKQTVAALLAGLVVLLPLIFYFAAHPKDFIGRAGQVSIFSPSLQQEFGGGTLLGTALYSTRQTILSFFYVGDLNWRHNVSGYPLLNPLVGFLFVLGILWAIKGTYDVGRQIIRGSEVHLGMIYPYLLLIIVTMLLPVIATAEGMPHALRSIGLFAPIYMLAGTAGAVFIRWSIVWGTKWNLTGVIYGLTAGLLIVFSLYSPLLYFIVSRNSPESYKAYRGDLTVVSDYINQYVAGNKDKPRPYLALDSFFVQSVHFLVSVVAHEYGSHPDEVQHKYTLLDPATSDRVLVKSGEVIIFTASTILDADRYEQLYKNSITRIESKMNKFGEEVMRVYTGNEIATPKQEFDLDA
ncbi:MAG: glycosyltransferase family 39 protein [bacterium]|nr:glycosyltransferase family 39 protein [bacterium]